MQHDERPTDGVAPVVTPVPGAGLPPALALLWRPAPVGRRGPRPGLTLAGIAEAAIALADAEGLSAVSMARVARRLGVTTMALYRYVPAKDALLALMLDSVLAEVVASTSAPDPSPGERGRPVWRVWLERWCHSQLRLARVHPWAVDPAVVTGMPGPAQVALIDQGLRALEGTPLTWSERAAVVGRVSLHVLAEGQIVAAEVAAERAAAAAATAGTGADADPVEAAHPALMDFGTLLRAVADPEQHPVLTEAVAAGAFDDGRDAVGEGDAPDLGLRMMLDGVAALVERAGRRASGG